MVDARTVRVVKTLAVGGRPRAAAFLPNGTKAYVTQENGGSVTVVGLPAHDILKTLKVEGRPMGISRHVTSAPGWVVDGTGVIHRLIPRDR